MDVTRAPIDGRKVGTKTNFFSKQPVDGRFSHTTMVELEPKNAITAGSKILFNARDYPSDMCFNLANMNVYAEVN